MKSTRMIVFLLAAIVFIIMMPAITVNALDEKAEQQLDEIKSNISERLDEGTDNDTKQILSDLELDTVDPESLGSLSFGSVMGKIISLFFGQLSSPAGMLGKLIASAVLCTLAQSLSTGKSEITEIYRITGTLAAVLSVYGCLSECITVTVDCLNELVVFMLSYIPVFAGITSASGSMAAGTSFYGTNLFLCECTAFAAKSVLTPLLGILTAFSVVGAVNPDVKIGNAAAAVKKAICWLIGIIMTVFTGMLTIQSAVGSAADSARSKALRFAASSFIPIIGGSVSETYSAVRGSLGMIRAGTGSVGVVIIAVIVLRPLLMLIASRAVLAVGKLCCEILGQNGIAQLASEVGCIITIALSITICISIMFIISTCIIMLTASNAGV